MQPLSFIDFQIDFVNVPLSAPWVQVNFNDFWVDCVLISASDSVALCNLFGFLNACKVSETQSFNGFAFDYNL